ncbi:uncharacterized protein ACMZJ9_001173 [Mantella aurantiaca]
MVMKTRGRICLHLIDPSSFILTQTSHLHDVLEWVLGQSNTSMFCDPGSLKQDGQRLQTWKKTSRKMVSLLFLSALHFLLLSDKLCSCQTWGSSNVTLSWVYYLTGCSIVLITSILAYQLFKKKCKRNNLKKVSESHEPGISYKPPHNISEDVTTALPSESMLVQQEKAHHLYSEIDFSNLVNHRCSSDQPERTSPISMVHKDSEEQHLYSEIVVCPHQEEEQHPPQENSSIHLSELCCTKTARSRYQVKFSAIFFPVDSWVGNLSIPI